MSDRLEQALVEVLARIDAGEEPSADELRAAYPDCWEAIRDVFDLRGRLRDAGVSAAAFAVAHGAADTKLRVVDAGRYERFRLLGEGGMGTVYWALDTELNREVAFKVVRPDTSPGRPDTPPEPNQVAVPFAGTPASQAFETIKARFLQEAWVTAGLEHPGIVPVYEVGETQNGVPFYTMRFVRGSRTLTQAMDEARPRPLEERLALLEPFLRICDTMRYAHAHGVVHRDLKPDNVALGEFGEVVVLDWGIAKLRDRPDAAAATWKRRLHELREAADLKTRAGALGTPGYMSPEAATGRIDEVDERSDVYSLGAILFQTLTGRLPYEFRTYGELLHAMHDGPPPEPASLDAAIPPELSAICVRALARDREARQQSVDALATDLRAWLAKRARDHEIEVLEHEATAAMAAAADLEGDALLRQLDRVHSAATKVLDRAPENNTATGLLLESEVRRETGIRQREHATRRRILRRTAFAGLAAALLAAVSVAWMINEERNATERARDTARAAVGAKDAALHAARSSGLLNASGVAERFDPMLALLLARAACREELLPRTLTQLHQAIFHSLVRAELRGHVDKLRSAHYSPTGDRIVTASIDRTARIWNLEGRQLQVLRGHERAVTSAVWAPSGGRILTASDDGTARLWDTSGTEIAVLAGHTGRVVSAVFAPSGKLIVTASADDTARLWNAEGRLVKVLAGHSGPLNGAIFSPAGDRVLTFSKDGTARVWDSSGTLLAVLEGHEAPIDAAVFSSSGDRIATASEDTTARLWSVAGGPALAVMKGHTSWVDAVAISPKGDRVLTGSMDETARIWDAAGDELRTFHGHQNAVSAVAFAPGGDWGVTASHDGTVRVWDGAGREVSVLLRHANWIGSLEFSPSGETVLTSSSDCTARTSVLWGEEVASCRGHTGPLGMAIYSPAGDAILTTSEDGTARLWHADGRPAAPPLVHAHDVLDAAFSPSGDRVATGSLDGSATLWDRAGLRIATLSPPAAVMGPNSDVAVMQIRFSSRTQSVLVAAMADPVRLWDRNGTLLKRFPGADDVPAISVDISSDESRIVVGGGDGSVVVLAMDGHHLVDERPVVGRVWTATFVGTDGRILVSGDDGVPRLLDSTGKIVVEFKGLRPGWSMCAASDSGSLFAGFSASNPTARLWSADGRLVAALRHDATVRDVEISPSEDLLVTASDDGTARLWSAAGRLVATLAGHDGHVKTAQFSPDGSRVVTAGADGTAQIWLTREADVVALAEKRTVRGLTRAEREEYADLLGPENEPALAAYRLLDARDDDTEPLADAVARVGADASLAAETRTAFKALADAHPDSPDKLAETAWNLDRMPAAAAPDVARALHLAEAAAQLAPGDGVAARVLGAAQYRAGRFADALATLQFSESQGRKCRPLGRPADAAFLAMTLFRLGRVDDARLRLDALRLSIADTTWRATDDDRLLAAEAEALVAAK